MIVTFLLKHSTENNIIDYREILLYRGQFYGTF
jgi:hypothetical protein